jgi:hypothetical protein
MIGTEKNKKITSLYKNKKKHNGDNGKQKTRGLPYP